MCVCCVLLYTVLYTVFCIVYKGIDTATGELTDRVLMEYPPTVNIVFDLLYDSQTKRFLTVAQNIDGDHDYYVGEVDVANGTGHQIFDSVYIYAEASYPMAVSLDVPTRSLFVLFNPADGAAWEVVRADIDNGQVVDSYTHKVNDMEISQMVLINNCTTLPGGNENNDMLIKYPKKY